MKTLRKIIEINEELCDGCGQCVPSCAEGAIQIMDGKARVVSDNLCDGLGACLGECPNGALRIVEREADEFDEVAVEKHLESHTEIKEGPSLDCGCPSRQLKVLVSERNIGDSPAAGRSALGQWPIQIRLVPPEAPFLKGADLLVIADCVAVAYPHLHRDFLKGRAVMMGCPKFDDAEGYVRKFAQVFKAAGLKSVSIVTMEVPCCSGLPHIVKKGMAASGTEVPLKEIVISARGEIISETPAGSVGGVQLGVK